MTNKLIDLALDPHPHKTVLEYIIRKFKLGSYETRLKLETLERPHYAYCIFQAASLAKKLNLPKISVIEFGVAGGNGLLNMENHAEEISKLLGVEIDVYGFDTGKGLPTTQDYKDLVYYWQTGFYEMNVEKLKSKLNNSKLILGKVEDTLDDFIEKHNPAPIGAISFDLDYYSSTTNAFKLLKIDSKYTLPRIFCYFDDIIGNTDELQNEFVGELLAINEFNQSHIDAKFGKANHFLAKKVMKKWYYQIRILHQFTHPKYNVFIGEYNQQHNL